MKLFSLLFLLLSVPAFAGGDYHHKPPEPTPINIPDDGSNHNALAIAVFIAAGVCVYHKCWKPKPVKTESGLVPEIPENEYMKIRQRR